MTIEDGPGPGLRQHVIAVRGMHRLVAVAVEHDGGHGPAGSASRSRHASVPHGRESRDHVGGGARRETGMHAGRRVEVRIGLHHNGRRGPARREAGHEDARRVAGEITQDLARQSCDERRLAAVALLVLGFEPVPALLSIAG